MHVATLEHVEARPSAPRWLALDLFRFCAVCLMVQGHVFSTLLDSATKSQRWYPHHSFVHGYTAPMFLLGAGLAFGYTTFRAWDEHAKGGPATIKRFKRYAWLLVIGYALHLPTMSLSRLFALDEAQLRQLAQVDVLQHIGVTLALCQLLVLLVKRRRAFVAVVAVLAAASAVAAPWVWAIDLEGVSPWLAGYVNASTGSQFPLVPWSGFTLFGIVLAHAIGIRGDARSVSERVRWPLAVVAAAFLIVPVLIDRFGVWPWPAHNFWKVNPLFFSWRLGNALAVLALLCFAERAIERAGWSGSRVLSWVKLVGTESLIIYVVHLVLLHGSVLGPGLAHTETLGRGTQGVLGASAVTLVLFSAMVLLAKMWSELRKTSAAFTAAQLGLTGGFVLLMLMHG
ncbi:MAG TPA: heparan-alpha-glucosaminide N-acetyltransferase domain-containing protein [Sandaracinaceae bacterium]